MQRLQIAPLAVRLVHDYAILDDYKAVSLFELT
jgi:hypothetical protein